jgi:type IV secretion system protein VirB5
MRMLKALSLAAIIAGSAGAAQAQMVVIDPSAIGKQVEQLQQMVQQLNTMKQQLDQAQQLYGSLNKLTDMNSVASVLNNPQIRNALPREFSQIESLFKGNGTGALGNLVNSYASSNPSYSSPGNDFYAQELAKLNKTNAAAQSLAQSIYEGASQRMDGIEQLRQRLSSASDAKDVLDLQARLQAEQAFLQTDLLRMQGLRMIQQAQVDVNAQRRQEEERRQIDRLGAALR